MSAGSVAYVESALASSRDFLVRNWMLLGGAWIAIVALIAAFTWVLGDHGPGPVSTAPPPVARQEAEQDATATDARGDRPNLPSSSTVGSGQATTGDRGLNGTRAASKGSAIGPNIEKSTGRSDVFRFDVRPGGIGDFHANVGESGDVSPGLAARGDENRLPSYGARAQANGGPDPKPGVGAAAPANGANPLAGKGPGVQSTTGPSTDLSDHALLSGQRPTILAARKHRLRINAKSAAQNIAPLPPPAPPAVAWSAPLAPAAIVDAQDAAAEATASRLKQPVVWNYWLDSTGAPDAQPHPVRTPLLKGSTGHLRFRLSLLDLAKLFEAIGTHQTAQELDEAIREGVQGDAAAMNLTVLISPVDEKRLRIAQDARQLSIKIDLNAIRQALAEPQSVPQIGQVPLEEVLRRTTVVQFGVDFDVLAAGRHQIGIAMLDASSGNPMQSLIAELQTGVGWPDSLQLKANGQSLFSEKSPPFDLTLTMFGSGPQVKSDASNELHAWLGARDRTTGNYDFVAWTADVSLRGLVDASASFLVTEGAVETGAALKDASVQFSDLIFNPLVSNSPDQALASQKNVDNAQRARAMIVAAAQYEVGTKPPSMLVSILGGADQELGKFASTVLPIGALGVSAATGEAPVFLGERFALALMLNGQPPGAGGACAPNWYMSVPNKDIQTTGPLFDALKGLDAVIDRWPKDQWRSQPASLKDLKEWLGVAAAPGTADSFVFAYLGHHDMGRLFLRDKTDNNLLVGSVKRQFGNSSIAILNACSSAMKEISDGTWIGRLAKRNVAATIVTTSPISGHLAAAYMDCMSTVLMKSPELTVGEAHALTTQCLWSLEGGKPWGRQYAFSGSALKYLLVGNPFQRICAPSIQQAKQQ